MILFYIRRVWTALYNTVSVFGRSIIFCQFKCRNKNCFVFVTLTVIVSIGLVSVGFVVVRFLQRYCIIFLQSDWLILIKSSQKCKIMASNTKIAPNIVYYHTHSTSKSPFFRLLQAKIRVARFRIANFYSLCIIFAKQATITLRTVLRQNT